MSDHDQYMADFMKVFAGLDRWGPGSEEDTLKAWHCVPHTPKNILEIGCGRGIATTLLAQQSEAAITALDSEPSALERLSERAHAMGVADRITPVLAPMEAMPFESESFDLIWCEGSAYSMGVEAALAQWRPLLTADGVLVLSDLVWLVDQPSAEALAFWQKDYPDMRPVAERLAQAKAAGYEVLETFSLSEQSWQAYAKPLAARVAQLRETMPNAQALVDIERELNIYHQYLGQFGYQMFVLKVSA